MCFSHSVCVHVCVNQTVTHGPIISSLLHSPMTATLYIVVSEHSQQRTGDHLQQEMTTHRNNYIVLLDDTQHAPGTMCSQEKEDFIWPNYEELMSFFLIRIKTIKTNKNFTF